ncbi:hypothetical protein [Phytomonospora endophytica]|uniref:Uncharacterized protein n=1 Tax=Phytomonospora endophytica TaxID=714109 RepID=A0A841FR43_9ACTN|nr:hypothetical protein [Phytomonospora endophytica]MBB6034430.1 hypothetical protein [Phytomonospora endophytica]
MKIITKAADRLLSRLVPAGEAHAAPCERQRYRCLNGRYYRCWWDDCQNIWLDCTFIANGC